MKTIKEYFSDGKTIDRQYQINDRGQKHGLYQSWYQHGQLEMECTYVNGKIHGTYKYFGGDGKIWDESKFVNGKLKIKYDYYENQNDYKPEYEIQFNK